MMHCNHEHIIINIVALRHAVIMEKNRDAASSRKSVVEDAQKFLRDSKR